MSSDKIVIEIDRDIYRLCLVCIAVLLLPVFFLFILPWTGMLGSPISIFVTWPLIVIVMLYCFSRWKSEPSTDTDLLRNQSEPVFEE
ncbi:MAG: hypothetical protein ACXABX_03460 [Candidatus Thorarchaeota archaeon]